MRLIYTSVQAKNDYLLGDSLGIVFKGDICELWIFLPFSKNLNIYVPSFANMSNMCKDESENNLSTILHVQSVNTSWPDWWIWIICNLLFILLICKSELTDIVKVAQELLAYLDSKKLINKSIQIGSRN